jgi:hypothetical protein
MNNHAMQRGSAMENAVYVKDFDSFQIVPIVVRHGMYNKLNKQKLKP